MRPVSDRRLPRSIGILGGLAALTIAATSLAADGGKLPESLPEPTPPAPTEPASAASEAGAAGLVIYIDPATGELTTEPTAEQVEALHQTFEARHPRSTAGLVAFELEHGGRGVFLGNRFQSALVARPRADGTFELRCADHPVEADVDPPPPAWEER